MTIWADQQILASLLLLLPVTVAALALVSARWFLAVAPLRPVVRVLDAHRRRHWQVLSVPLRRPDLPGRPQPRAPGRSPAGV